MTPTPDRASDALDSLHVRVFADGADLAEMRALCSLRCVSGFTTNPTLMRKAGVGDYRRFARNALAIAGRRPVSFEVLADDFEEMERQAREIASWSASVVVKIPITNTHGASTAALTRRLAQSGIHVNVTAAMTVAQVEASCEALRDGAAGYVSVFAGRIADTGRDPVPIIAESVRLAEAAGPVRIIWASPREVLNIFQADAAGCHVITVTADLLHKLALIGRRLDEFSLETVRTFYCDAQRAGLRL